MIYENYEELIKEHQIPIYSDLFEFTQLYKSFGIECKIFLNKTINLNHIFFRIILSGNTSCKIEEYATTNNKITGVSGFFTIISFNKDGKFLGQEIKS